MSTYKTFSKRNLPAKNDEVLFDDLPRAFRVQVAHLWRAAFGEYRIPSEYNSIIEDPSPSNRHWEEVNETLCKEMGVFTLGKRHESPDQQCLRLLLTGSTKEALDVIELTFRVIDETIRKWDAYRKDGASISQDADDAIEELNDRFNEHSLVFRYESGEIIRVTSEYIHQEITAPALNLLKDTKFEGANEEFCKGHLHYRNGHTKEAITEAAKSLESTLKTIFELEEWAYDPNASLKKQLDFAFEKGLLPEEFTSQFSGLRSALESGVGTARNKMSSHGQGSKSKPVPEHIATYALALTASAIRLLFDSYMEMKKRKEPEPR